MELLILHPSHIAYFGKKLSSSQSNDRKDFYQISQTQRMENEKSIEKYALSIYHFNLQYKAGDKDSYFRLHKASMQPFLRFFLQYPKWNVSCEIQGHYLDFMARHFPEDLEKFRTLNQRGQLELVCVHYSDQIFLAYPERDLVESLKINDEIFDKYGLIRSNVWFGQENFFGQGLLKNIFPRFGFRTALLNKHYHWHHDMDYKKTDAPFWAFHEVDDKSGKTANFLTSSGQRYVSEEHEIQQRFSYWGDAELAFGSTPYLPWLAKPKRQYIQHALKYFKLQKEGYKISTVSDYIDRCLELKLKPAVGPPLTEGSWNIRYYGGVYLWMGYYRLPFERDGDIRSRTFQTRAELLKTEALLQWALREGILVDEGQELRIWLRMAWRHQLLAEVSDSTGQTPFPIELAYSYNECEECLRYCRMIFQTINVALQAQGKTFPGRYFDLFDQKFRTEPPLVLERNEQVDIREIQNWFETPINLLRVKKRKSKASLWRADLPSGFEGEHFLLDFSWSNYYTLFLNRVFAFFKDSELNPKFTEKFDNYWGNYAGIKFPLADRKLRYCPALLEDEFHTYSIEDFSFRETWLPLPNGLIGLGNDVYVIKHNRFGNTHIACTVDYARNPSYAGFIVLNPPRNHKFDWRFSLFRGSEQEAVELANRLNVSPCRPTHLF